MRGISDVSSMLLRVIVGCIVIGFGVDMFRVYALRPGSDTVNMVLFIVIGAALVIAGLYQVVTAIRDLVSHYKKTHGKD